MLGHFLYFIVVLLIYLTYPASEAPNFTPAETIVLFAALSAAFGAHCRFSFQRLDRLAGSDNRAGVAQAFDRLLQRYMVAAVGLFAVDVYGLSLPAYTSAIDLLSVVPTVEALGYLLLFTVYLTIVWSQAHRVYRRLYAPDLNRRAYVLSNLSFGVPALLPWLVLSGLADLIRALPFDGPRQWLETPGGQIVYLLVFLLFVAAVGPVFIQRFWRCRPLPSGFFRQRIAALCTRAGIRYADILSWPVFGGRMVTAGVMGLVGRFRYILVTEGLLRLLSPEEIDAVIAHEIGHVKRHHLIFYLVFFVGYMLFSYAVFDLLIKFVIYFDPVYELIKNIDTSQTTVVSVMFSLTIVSFFLIYFRYVFGYFMRNFERQADIYVYRLFDSARPLISTLAKIAAVSGQPADKPNWHHFSIRQRMDYLLRCEQDRGWIQAHDRKVRRSMGLYLAFAVLVGAFGYQLNFGQTGQEISNRFMEKAVRRELAADPGRPELLRLLGDLLYQRRQWTAAAETWQRALINNPDDPEVLNNLAWLYATGEDPAVRDPDRALSLARRAAGLKPQAHILDTLAEANFVSGNPKAALEIATHALATAERNREYYRGQTVRFRQALEDGGRND